MTPTAPATPTKLSKREVRALCTRALSGHKPKSVREWLTSLAASPLSELSQDVYGEGQAIGELEREVAALLGKEAGVFVIKGIIAQQIALRVWTDRSGCPTVAIHPKSHIDLDEGDAYERLHPLRGLRLGEHQPFKAKDLDAAAERIGAVTVELPLRRAGFKLPTWDELVAISDWCKEHRVPLHFDGARLWETAPFYGRDYAEISALADSVYVSFYKGLSGLGGCILAGPTDFITESRVWKKRHGGDLFTAFPYVISAQEGIRKYLPRMASDFARAQEIAVRLSTVPGITVVPNPPHTNAFQIFLPGSREKVEQAALDLAEAERTWLFGYFTDAELPNMTMAEFSAGEATDDFTNEEVVTLIGKLVERILA